MWKIAYLDEIPPGVIASTDQSEEIKCTYGKLLTNTWLSNHEFLTWLINISNALLWNVGALVANHHLMSIPVEGSGDVKKEL